VQFDDEQHNILVRSDQGNNAVDFKKVWCGKVTDVQDVALKVFGPEQYPAQKIGLLRQAHAERGLGGLERRKGVADGTDATDARGDGCHFAEMPANHHRFEETRRFGHLPFQFIYGAVINIDDDVSVPSTRVTWRTSICIDISLIAPTSGSIAKIVKCLFIVSRERPYLSRTSCMRFYWGPALFPGTLRRRSCWPGKSRRSPRA